MKKILTIPLFCFLLISARAQNYKFDSIGFKQMEIGRIMLKADTWIIRVDHGAFHNDYWPINLPEKYCIKGQEVVFEGALGKIPMNMQLAGTPVRISLIRNLYRTMPGNNTGETIANDDAAIVHTQNDSVGFIDHEQGIIKLIGDTWVIEQIVNEETKRYVADFIPEDFKIENTNITFSAVIKKTDPKVRMMGIPISISELFAEENVPFDASKLQEPMKDFYPFDSVGYLQPIKGVIKKMGTDPDVFIVEVPVADNGIVRYLPAILPEEFQKEGLSVIVSGVIGKIPANVRMMGTPLELNEISPSK